MKDLLPPLSTCETYHFLYSSEIGMCYLWLFILPIFLIAVWEVPKTTHMFSFSLEGFTEVRKVITITVTIYYNERILIKISQ